MSVADEADKDELENPVWNALRGVQHGLGLTGNLAGCLYPSVGPFAGLQEPTEPAFRQLAMLGGPGRSFAFVTAQPVVPAKGWTLVQHDTLEQFVCPVPIDRPPLADLSELTAEDAGEMLRLAAATKPGPFEAETMQFGRYIGCRVAGELVAMAGERFRLSSATEISAVCTADSHRGQGLAGRMIAALANEILRNRRLPFLHVRHGNTAAIRLYGTLGFCHSRTLHLRVLRSPGTSNA